MFQILQGVFLAFLLFQKTQVSCNINHKNQQQLSRTFLQFCSSGTCYKKKFLLQNLPLLQVIEQDNRNLRTV